MDNKQCHQAGNIRVNPAHSHGKKNMCIDKIVNAMAGTLILLSLGLGVQGSPIFHNVNWLWFTAFIGANLLQSSFTGFCPAAILFKKLGAKPGAAFE
jgi:hypothetical protein